MRASLPCLTVPGPVDSYEVLRADPIPTLFAFREPSDWQYILGDVAGLHRLAFLARLAATRRDTVVHLPLRRNPNGPLRRELARPLEPLDLVLAPRHVALTPKTWKTIRSWKSIERCRVVFPPLGRVASYPVTRVPYEKLDARGMDRRVGVGTLFLSGDRATFDGLADFAMWAARFRENWTGTHLDRILRHGEIDLLIEYWDANLIRRDEHQAQRGA